MDRFFYNEKKDAFTTHLEAIASKSQCKFYYGDAFYDTVDWTTEPTVSLEALYKARAEEIRSEYEYVVVCLSGGVDSRNVFESFYHNNIHIDEILCVGAYSQDDHKESEQNNNDEIYINVYPLLDNVHLPDTTITFFDYSKLFEKHNQITLLRDHGNDWANEMTYFKSFHNFFWYDLKQHLNIAESKKACYVMGTGKTPIALINEKPCVMFAESDIMDYGARYSMDNLTRENFYFGLTDIGADIVKKQAYTMLRLMDTKKDMADFFKNYLSYYPKIIYDLKFPLIKPTRKCKMPYYSHRDTFMKKHGNSDIYKLWYEGLEKVSRAGNLTYSSHRSKPYFLSHK